MLSVTRVKRDYGRNPKVADAEGRYRCSKCREWKAPELFNRNRNQLSGLNYACKPCSKISVRRYNLPNKYGISSQKFEEMLVAQGGKCACCGIVFDTASIQTHRPCVDHNHNTGEVRDLLCGRCNLAAGNVFDSSACAEQLASYLRKWKC